MRKISNKLPPPKEPSHVDHVRSLRVGQTYSTDEITRERGSVIASRIKHDAKNTAREGVAFNVTQRGSTVYITRVS